MNVFAAISGIGGLAMFLYGMHILSTGLEKIAGGRLERILHKLTSNRLKGLALGIAVTALIQSSSAVTVILVGLVNSGTMQLPHAISVIMGSNIGTTITAWLLSLVGIESSNVLVKLLKPDSFSPILAFIGLIMLLTGKNGRKREIGNTLLGFAILMFGMSVMSDAVSPLRDIPEFTNLMVQFSNPLLGIFIGFFVTAVIQSSSASVGILQAISMTGSVTFGSAIPIIMGQNIGTCVTALLSSIGTNTNARRVAAVHVYFNVIGTLVWSVVLYSLNAVFKLAFLDSAATPFGIAVAHSVFNILTTLLLPFAGGLEKLAQRTVSDKKGSEAVQLLDERFLRTPAFAVEQCRKVVQKMAELSCNTLRLAIESIGNFDPKIVETIEKNEAQVDQYEDILGTYLVKLSGERLPVQESREVARQLHSISDFERICDHAVNISASAVELHDKGVTFSEHAWQEFNVISGAITEILDITLASFKHNDTALACKVEPLEQVIDDLKQELKLRHIARLQDGICTITQGFDSYSLTYSQT